MKDDGGGVKVDEGGLRMELAVDPTSTAEYVVCERSSEGVCRYEPVAKSATGEKLEEEEEEVDDDGIGVD